MSELARSIAAEVMRTIIVVADGHEPDRFGVARLETSDAGLVVGRRTPLNAFLKEQSSRNREVPNECPDFETLVSPAFRQRLVDGLDCYGILVFNGETVNLQSLPGDIQRDGYLEHIYIKKEKPRSKIFSWLGTKSVIEDYPLRTLPVFPTRSQVEHAGLVYARR